MDALSIIHHFYPADDAFRKLLLLHSNQVKDKALQILSNCDLQLDRTIVENGALLHDIGIGRCHAPSILCNGTEPYLAHGIIGAAMLRELDTSLEPYARICERHTGTGITAAEIVAQSLPIPIRDYLPETPEEKLICLADKFFSKSGDLREKSLADIRRSLSRFGSDTLTRLDEMCALFSLVVSG
ncbi:MAG: HDIG domain-containing protein [Victivallales bacterium]|nr:HDIG domain-containing protein [Victivallales bacterium]